MKNAKVLGGWLAATLTTGIGTAEAALSGPVTIGFDTLGAAVFGRANVAPLASGACPLYSGGGCYYEGSGAASVAVGALDDPTNGGAHVHGDNYDVTNLSNKGLAYHSDSAGLYVRLKDSSAFSLKSMRFIAPITASNPDSGVNDYWKILGYNTAINPTLSTGSVTPDATQTVANGFNGTVTLGSAFANIKSFWIHYHGYTTTPADPDLVVDPDTGETLSDGPLTPKVFKMVLDDVVMSTPVTAPVPIPAGVWLFASGVAGLLGLGRRKRG